MQSLHHGCITSRILSRLIDRWHWGRRSIIVRLVMLGLALVTIGAISRAVVLSSFLRDEIESLSAAHQGSIAAYAARDIDEKLKIRLGLVERLAAALTPALLDDPVGLQAWLKERQETFPLFSRGIAVLPLDGQGAIAEYPPLPGRRERDYTNADWFRGARDRLTPTIGRPVRSPLDGEPVILMAAPVLAADGAPVAVLIGATALASPGFLNLVQQNRVGRTGSFLLISPRDRLFVAAYDPRMVLTPTPPDGVNPLHDRAMAGYRGTGITVSAQGVEELSAIASVPTTGWFLVARLPTAEAFEAVHNGQAAIVPFTLIIMMVLVAVLLLMLSHFFRPLTDAARQMRRMADGTARLAPLPVARHDEVGELVLGFNSLLHKLREQEAALRESEARMSHLAHHDTLTGLPNRAMFHDRLGQAIAQAGRDGSRFALLYVDLDRFKPINDTYGHGVGDEVLRQVAARLMVEFQGADTVARIGGDEFAVLLTGWGEAHPAYAAARRVCLDGLTVAVQIDDDLAFDLRLSIGHAVFPEDGVDADHLVGHADRAMYAAKNAGQPAIP